MNDIFKLRNTDGLAREKDKLNLEIPKSSQVTLRTEALRATVQKYGMPNPTIQKPQMI